MHPLELQKMYEVEQIHWWYLGLHDLVIKKVSEHLKEKKEILILDAGCGTGATLFCLHDFGKTFGFDLSEHAIAWCKKRNLKNLFACSIDNIGVTNAVVDLVVSLDVLCILKPGTPFQKGILEIYRILKPGGYLFLNLPAFQWLYSRHDVAVGTKQRFTKKDLISSISKAGFEVQEIFYWNCLLFPVLAVYRLLSKRALKNKTVPKFSSDVKPVPKFLNKLLKLIILFENKIHKYLTFPAGLSVFAVVRKPL